ncbi:exodeoxyribonuclease VII large subunit [Butyrivibrio sp. YAB3001]|uniref:exodeoxyribonuclease VII large subunit n=1 Tax=Butyrivibrio sp. YAB3001 TaxID=1520812 RepID=UPI0008F66A23|nr:exodeoxyribonuclease VII large subunit [Butyrivibrio sp. YAB3001]SFC92465.1 Exodeoxyribonuclease VII large subunit [Butyrivibrio sp. YAB3001]
MRSEYTVTQVNAYIRNMFAQDFLLKAVTVKGEVSNCKYHSSGHIYFTIKDSGAAIACVMFRGDRAGLKFNMQEGQQVKVTGSIDVYERDGKYQLYAREIQLDGAGALYERYEELKRKMQELGMFADEYKLPIPRYIKTLGVVTAPTGAAVRDIINVATRRNPHIQIILYPAIVQGDQAAESIVEGIHTLSQKDVDVIIVGRGGGSIEDLWAFNEEIVAQAIFDCPIPIISAVGHETDTTIADFVADRRAPTPSAAAELAVFEYDRLIQDIQDYSYSLNKLISRKLDGYKMLEKNSRDSLRLLSPMGRVKDRLIRLDQYQDKLSDNMAKRILELRHRLDVNIEKLKGLSPLDRLKGGYSYVSDKDGRNIRSIEGIKAEDELSVYVTDGVIRASVIDVEQRLQ